MMNEAPLRLVNTTLPPILTGATFDFEKGSITAIVAGSGENCAMLLEAFLGMRAASGGCVEVFGEDPGNLSESRLRLLRSRIGVHIYGGGLISNLKAVENVTLPLLHHSSEKAVFIFEKALHALTLVGYMGDPFAPPGRLSAFQRAAVGMARVVAIDPGLVICDRLGDGLPAAQQKSLVDMALDLHWKAPGRTTVLLFPDPDAIPGGDASITVLNLSEGGLL